MSMSEAEDDGAAEQAAASAALRGEVVAILEEVGAEKIDVRQDALGWLVAAVIHGFGAAGHTGIDPATSDDPRDMARRLIANTTPAARETELVFPNATVLELTPQRVVALAPEDEQSDTLKHEDNDGSNREASDRQMAGDDDLPGVGRGDILPGQKEAPAAPEALDADFAELPAIDEPVPEDTEVAGPESVAIFGPANDNLPLLKLLKIGLLSEHAARLIARTRTGARFDAAEMQATRAYVVSHLDAAGAYVGGSPETYDRFVELSNADSRVKAIEAYRDDASAAIRDSDSKEWVAAFVVEAGWPGP